MTRTFSGFRIPIPVLSAELRAGVGVLSIVLGVMTSPTAALAQADSSVAAARTAILIETEAFQRDLTAKDWNALLLHFWPAKITARWEPPAENRTWAQLSLRNRATVGSGSGASGISCQRGSAEVAVVGRWARVLLPACAARPTELWLLDVNGQWKIVHLDLGDG